MSRPPTVLLSWVVAGFLATPLVAQTIPEIGWASTLDVATWNIEWFGSTSRGPSDEDLQLQNAASVMRDSGIDLWAVQEIDDDEHFRSLVDELGEGWAGDLDDASTNFRLGFIYRTAVVTLRQKRAILTQFSDAFAGRPPMQLQVAVALPQDTLEVVLITLHMKAFDDAASYDRRAEAATRLKNHIDFFLDGDAVIVLGDFNDELTTSITTGRESPYLAFIEDSDDYAFLTLPLDEEDQPTYCFTSTCSPGSTIDHILITDELFDAYEEGSTASFADLLDGVERYTFTTSDHLPVYARFRFVENTSAFRPESPAALSFGAVFPNPARESASLAYSMASPGQLVVRVFDAIGREVRRVEDGYALPGEHTLTVETAGLAPGVYFMYVTAGGRTGVRPFTLAR